uniref:DUF5745 domain-containing protein n=1 Tax=Cynoglossus semilaevis TaxID=244447 RepID=A0A3P8VSW9_CYNSE
MFLFCVFLDWVDVANDLFNKCHVNLRLRKLTDCDAQVFTALYENILGEKVPDYIAEPCSQEDDVHNVQSVIDSLSLDYLQISLSHITGENVVRGDKESIKNLLEIFDGLVEYLNEEINEESQIIESEKINISLTLSKFLTVKNEHKVKLPEERFKDPPLYCRQRNRKAEEELHLISENLSHRLEELDEVVHFLALNSTLPVRWDFLLFWHVYLLLFFTGFKTSLFKFTTNSLLFCSSVNVRENELLPVLLKEMPHLQISPEALGRMWEQQLQQVDRLHSMSLSQSQNHHKLISQVGFEEERRKHDLLVEITRKERDHNRRLREFKEHIQQQRSSQNRLKEQRQQIARAKKYHREYHVQHRARLMRARTKEEKMFQNLFKEGLEIQKARLREQRTYAKEQQLESQKRHQDRMTSMENYYKDQFSLLADRLAQEQQEIQVRKKAQEKALQKLKRELRSRMERDITELQKVIVRNDEDDYFEDLEVQSLRNRISRASFKTSPRP